MKVPRDVSGDQLIRALARVGYAVVRQSGSHVRMKTTDGRDLPLTLPKHSPIKIGTLAAILDDVATQQGLTREQMLQRLRL